jgi:hypothetical protein
MECKLEAVLALFFAFKLKFLIVFQSHNHKGELSLLPLFGNVLIICYVSHADFITKRMAREGSYFIIIL